MSIDYAVGTNCDTVTHESSQMIAQSAQSVPRRSNAPWVYLGINAPLVAVIFLFPRYHLYLWGLFSVGSAAAIVVGVVRHRPAHLVTWLFVVAGVTTFSLGDITYDVLTNFLHQSDPFPSLADVFYLATYLLLSAGLLTMVRARRRRDGETGALLDALIITTGLGVLSWIFLIQPFVHAANMTLLPKLTSIAYPLGDIVLLSVLVRLVFGGATRNASLRLLGIGAVGVLGADCAYGWIQLHGSWKVGGPVDLGWVLFYVCRSAAALHPAMRELTLEQPWRPRQLRLTSLALLSVSALAAPLLIVWRDVRGVPNDARSDHVDGA